MDFFSITELASIFKKPLYALHSSYKYVKLENGLRTLLISDPECRATAADVCVGAGSHSDPWISSLLRAYAFHGNERISQPSGLLDQVDFHGGQRKCVYNGRLHMRSL